MITRRTTVALSCAGTIAGFRTDGDTEVEGALRALSAISSRMRAFQGDRPISASLAVGGARTEFAEPGAPERVASTLTKLLRPVLDRLGGSGWDVCEDGAPTPSTPAVRSRRHASDADTLELPVQSPL